MSQVHFDLSEVEGLETRRRSSQHSSMAATRRQSLDMLLQETPQWIIGSTASAEKTKGQRERRRSRPYTFSPSPTLQEISQMQLPQAEEESSKEDDVNATIRSYLLKLRTKEAMHIFERRGEGQTVEGDRTVTTQDLVEQSLSLHTIACLARFSKESQQASGSSPSTSTPAPIKKQGDGRTIAETFRQSIQLKTNMAMAKNHLRDVLFGDSEQSALLAEKWMKQADGFKEDEWGLGAALQDDIANLQLLSKQGATKVVLASTDRQAAAVKIKSEDQVREVPSTFLLLFDRKMTDQ